MTTCEVALFDSIIAYEKGELDEEETLALYQNLVDTGLAWKLQGSYGRTAMQLASNGLIHLQGNHNYD